MKIEFNLNVCDPREVAAFQHFLSTVAEAAEERALSRPGLVEKNVPLQFVAEQAPEPKRTRKKKDEPAPAVFAGDEEPPRIPVYQPDGTVFSSVRTPEGYQETLLKLLGQCGDLDDVNGLWNNNRVELTKLEAEHGDNFSVGSAFDQARAAFAPKPPAVPTVDEIRAALKDMANSVEDGMVFAAKVLGEFGVSAVSALPEDKRAEFLAAVKKHTKAEVAA